MVEQVQKFYDRYPYPLAEVKTNSNLNGATLFSFLDYELRAKGFNGKTFLDAGCGTGHRILDVAKAFPHANFLAFDLSPKSIELAKQQAAKDQVSNIEFHTNNIIEYETEQLFDIIIANGVIHHLSQPDRGIKNLTRFLKEDGLFVAFTLHTYGEYYKMLQRELLLTLLGQQKHDFEAGVGLMREMGFSISQNRYGKGYSNDLTENDQLSKDADALLTPQLSTFTFQEAIELFKTANLDWVAIEQIIWQETAHTLSLDADNKKPFWVLDIKSLLKSETAYIYYQNLNKLDKLHIIELMTNPTGFSILAGKSNSLALNSKRIRENSIPLK